MKDRVNLIYATYNKESGKSEVCIDTDLGRFYGETILYPEDKDLASRYEGCKYAELKALRKYSTARIRILKEQLNTLLSLENSYKSSSRCSDDNSGERKILTRAIGVKRREIQDAREDVESLTKSLLTNIAERDKIVERIRRQQGSKVDNK